MNQKEKFENELKSLEFHLRALKNKYSIDTDFEMKIQIEKIEKYMEALRKEIQNL